MYNIIYLLLLLLKEKRLYHRPLGAEGTIPVLIGFVIITGIIIAIKVSMDVPSLKSVDEIYPHVVEKQSQRILSFAKKRKGPWRSIEVFDFLDNEYADGPFDRGGLKLILSQLVSKGEIEKVGRNRYQFKAS